MLIMVPIYLAGAYLWYLIVYWAARTAPTFATLTKVAGLLVSPVASYWLGWGVFMYVLQLGRFM